ncbi:hypothetical protein [Pseudomonas turukhanskensis]|uniref:Uncharacterized protein n=1 Tax=Pseudomonas turukhanskensis TaxID=1806536 RepID=A0A9W6K3J3_9PSED|nr:hypothetical protein [Pseudomonas turukhanskensis]GLK88112.1 hypothetical protein GCM10017655_11740 [Pseudomonas turukhanskensis]
MTDTPLPKQPARSERRGNRQPPKPQSPLYRALTGVCLVGALAALVPASQMLLAGLASHRAELALQRWAASAQLPAEAKWQSALDAAKQANALYPVASGTYLEQLGQVYSWKAFDQPAGADSARPSRLLAAAAYRQSAQARPTWPATWAHLAHSKYALDEFDSEFAQAMKQANEWGPYRPDVQLELASIGLRAWPMLNHQQRVDALISARHAMDGTNQAANTLFALAQTNGLEQTLCMSGVDELDGTRNYCTRGGNR